MKMNFYETLHGHKILDSQFWPKKLREYLIREDIFLVENIKKDSTVLDIGSGGGRHLKLLSNSCKKIIGIDNSKTMVDCTKKALSKCRNVIVLEVDVKYFKFPKDSFDFIICMFNTFGNMTVETQKICLDKMNELIKPDGIILMSVYSEKAIDTQIEHYNKIGLIVRGSDENFVYTEKFVSERFSEGKIKRVVESRGLKIKNMVKFNEISFILELEKGCFSSKSIV